MRVMVYTSCYSRLKPAMIVIALKCLVYNVAYTGKKIDFNPFYKFERKEYNWRINLMYLYVKLLFAV